MPLFDMDVEVRIRSSGTGTAPEYLIADTDAKRFFLRCVAAHTRAAIIVDCELRGSQDDPLSVCADDIFVDVRLGQDRTLHLELSIEACAEDMKIEADTEEAAIRRACDELGWLGNVLAICACPDRIIRDCSRYAFNIPLTWDSPVTECTALLPTP